MILIAERLSQEQDRHICRDLMLTITQDTSVEARVVAQNALMHTWADVRVLGCQYAQKHRLPQLAPFLLPLLQESSTTVQQAAILACGYSQNPVVIDGFSDASNDSSNSYQRSGLRSLLGIVNRQTELQVIASMARLGDEQGRAELHKLSYSTDAKTRYDVIVIMGELKDQNMVGHLIRIGWTEREPYVRVAVLNALKQIVPGSQQPKMNVTDTAEKKMQVWSDWFDNQQTD
ncbi:MAG: HEAT repeat domain-containing protein [Planctomycetaceae bacterium]|nr:HEAT repeat domain-containing protein [Planctomycetaceae bacterium]